MKNCSWGMASIYSDGILSYVARQCDIQFPSLENKKIGLICKALHCNLTLQFQTRVQFSILFFVFPVLLLIFAVYIRKCKLVLMMLLMATCYAVLLHLHCTARGAVPYAN